MYLILFDSYIYVGWWFLLYIYILIFIDIGIGIIFVKCELLKRFIWCGLNIRVHVFTCVLKCSRVLVIYIYDIYSVVFIGGVSMGLWVCDLDEILKWAVSPSTLCSTHMSCVFLFSMQNKNFKNKIFFFFEKWFFTVNSLERNIINIWIWR